MIWVVTMDSNTCHIYHYQKTPIQLTLIKEMTHPENRLKKSDFLTSDKPGHYQTGGTAHGAFIPHTDPKEAHIESFAREIAKELNHGRNTHAYEKLIIITSPHMDGLLFQHLDKHVKELVVNNIHKDLQHLNQSELLDFLKNNTQYQEGP